MKALPRQYSHLIQRISKEKKILLQIEQLIKTIGRIQHIVLLYRNEFINHHQVIYRIEVLWYKIIICN